MVVHPLNIGCHTPGHTAYALEWRGQKAAQKKETSDASGAKTAENSTQAADGAAAADETLPNPMDELNLANASALSEGVWGRAILFSGDALFAAGVGRFFEGLALRLSLALLQLVRMGARPPINEESPDSERVRA